ncbi:hypothetical protein VTJ83DRAFT_2011 [Remersonia thermophila]|uniref:PH domain-containing protein n=1 Tax=Remersonia thermophila TaxID=72144 RepID=A0ABR4DHI7_9PEZI
MAVNEHTLPELQPIFTLLNAQSNKLYQEGYFLKLDDQDIRGNPNPDRTWTECFAQLVGTVLSLWDAAELDAAGEDGEVLPKFINLTDASVKMIESLPTKSNDEQPLQNILSISTAGRNRYLLHFNSHHSLIQWTSAIRLAIFEHSTLQEAYTGALVAGKGKSLNNINIIMERARQPVMEWVRVRFGAGVPWRRCFCVIEPPSEKEYQKAQKEWKKRSPYDRSHGPVLKGEIRFFETRKDAEKKKKHQRPIASINDAYSAYAIYPQAKELIDSSTLLKIEGNIEILTQPASSTEGFVFIMPETHPAVSGFETLLRFLFPTWDTFALYGRPGRLVASALDARSLMFGMPKNKRHWYLDILDVSGLVLTEGSTLWSEREWRKKMKELTGQRMATMDDEPASAAQSRSTSRNSKRLSFGAQPAPSRPRVGFADDAGSIRSSRSITRLRSGGRDTSAPPDPHRERLPPPVEPSARHSRHISDPQLGEIPPGYSLDSSPPLQQYPMRGQPDRVRAYASDLASTPERVSSEDDQYGSPVRGPMAHLDEFRRMGTPEPVQAPPGFAHGAGARPPQRPNPSPEVRRATNRLSSNTLSQIAGARGFNPDEFPDGPVQPYPDQRGVAVQTQTSANPLRMKANLSGSRKVLTSPSSSGAGSGPGPDPDPDPNPLGTPPSPPRDPARPRSNSSLRRPAGEAAGETAAAAVAAAATITTTTAPADHPPTGGRRAPPLPGTEHQGGTSTPAADRDHDALPPETASLPGDQDDTPPSSPLLPPNYLQLLDKNASAQHDDEEPSSVPRHRGEPGVPRFPTQHRVVDQKTAEAMRENASRASSPDYASSRSSVDAPPPPNREERPRAGVLKVVGDRNAIPKDPDLDYEIPKINFGRTLNYAAPLLSGDKPSKHARHASGSAAGRKSPGPAAALSHSRQPSDDAARRSVAWPGPSAKPLSAENVVALQQAFQGRTTPTPLCSHQRIPSASTLADLRASHSRQSSADLLSTAQAGHRGSDPHKRPASRGLSHSRNSSVELLSTIRPAGEPMAAAPRSAGEISMHLSAREQEHVARVTGTPLIALAAGHRPSPTQGGLVGAIESREREKAQMKHGLTNQAVTQAIDQRQRELNMQAHRAAQAQYAQHQAQYVTAQQLAGVRPQTPGASLGRMMSPPRMDDSPGPAYALAPGSMSPGWFGGQQQQQQQQPWPAAPGTMSPSASYGGGRHSPGPAWAMGALPHLQGPPPLANAGAGRGGGAGFGGMPGVVGGLPMSPTQVSLPYSVPMVLPGTPPGVGPARPGTPGRMPFRQGFPGQAF